MRIASSFLLAGLMAWTSGTATAHYGPGFLSDSSCQSFLFIGCSTGHHVHHGGINVDNSEGVIIHGFNCDDAFQCNEGANNILACVQSGGFDECVFLSGGFPPAGVGFGHSCTGIVLACVLTHD